MKNRIKKSIVIGIFVLLSGCAEVRPFVDARREAGQVEPVGQSRPERIAVCYNAWWDDDVDILQLAEAECAKQGKHAVADGISYFNCRLVTPSTAFYQCR